MDNRQFDSLTRAMAVGTSRRALLKLLAGGAAAGGVAVVARDVALAECHGITCSSGDDCCAGAPECSGGVCVVAMSAPDPAPADDAGGATTAESMPATGAGPLEEDRRRGWRPLPPEAPQHGWPCVSAERRRMKQTNPPESGR